MSIKQRWVDLNTTLGGMGLFPNKAEGYRGRQWYGRFPDGAYVVVTRCKPHPREDEETRGKPWEVEYSVGRSTALHYFATKKEAKRRLARWHDRAVVVARHRVRLAAYHEERVRSL